MIDSVKFFQNTSDSHPFDWGVRFAFASFPLLFCFAAPNFFADIATSFILYYLPLSHSRLFLLTFASTAIKTWFICAVLMFGVEFWRGKTPHLGDIAKRALHFLPKTLFSLILVQMIVVGGLIFKPFLIFLVFFLWAPAFATCDSYATPPSSEDEESLLEDEEEILSKTPKPKLLFSNSLAGFGGIRSINLASAIFSLSLFIALVFWASLVIPSGVVAALFGPFPPFSASVIQHGISAICDTIALAIYTGTFLALLPSPAQKELGIISIYEQNQPSLLQNAKPKLFYRPLLLISIISASMLSTHLVIKEAEKSRSVPSVVTIEPQSIARDRNELVVRLRIDDPTYEYRWLDAEAFELQLETKEAQNKSSQQKETEAKLGMKDKKTLGPVSQVVFTTNGKELSPSAIRYTERTIELALRYDISAYSKEYSVYKVFYNNSLTNELSGPYLSGTLKDE